MKSATLSPNKSESKTASDEQHADIPEKEKDKRRDVEFRLGLWLSGLDSFLSSRSSVLVNEGKIIEDWSKEFRLTHSVLLLCSKLALEFADAARADENEDDIEFGQLQESDEAIGPKECDLQSLHQLIFDLRESILLSQSLLRAKPLEFREWQAWSNALITKLQNSVAVKQLIFNAETIGERRLPPGLEKLMKSDQMPAAWESDLRIVVPHFVKILNWLSVVKEMLNADLPLKPALILFARINAQMKEMTAYINNRLLRFPDEEDALFGSLDGAAYTASIELRKVYEQELKGIADIRPAPQIFAKFETAYSLLNDSLQMTLVNFARLIDPEIESTDIFPNLQTKEEQSIILRENMWKMLQAVKAAEKDPEEADFDVLNDQVTKFRDENLYFLFYKDMETVDRFIEEVLVTADKKDIVSLLHRFGAYLETLLGLVNMRVVLANHPFEPLNVESHQMF